MRATKLLTSRKWERCASRLPACVLQARWAFEYMQAHRDECSLQCQTTANQHTWQQRQHAGKLRNSAAKSAANKAAGRKVASSEILVKAHTAVASVRQHSMARGALAAPTSAAVLLCPMTEECAI